MENFEHQDPGQLNAEDLLRMRDGVVAQMAWARQYTLQLIHSVPHTLWYEKPAGVPSHLAWQVGHLAVSQYGLMLFRQRGRAPGDLELLPGWLRKRFGRGTQPGPLDAKSPTPEELLDRLQKIHEQALNEAAGLASTQLAEATDMPYAAYPIKLGALLFCPIHEALHAGQIGLIRRAHGLEPIR